MIKLKKIRVFPGKKIWNFKLAEIMVIIQTGFRETQSSSRGAQCRGALVQRFTFLITPNSSFADTQSTSNAEGMRLFDSKDTDNDVEENIQYLSCLRNCRIEFSSNFRGRILKGHIPEEIKPVLFEGTAYKRWIRQRLSLVIHIGNCRRYLLDFFATACPLKKSYSEERFSVFYFANDSDHLVRMQINYLWQFSDNSVRFLIDYSWMWLNLI